MRIEDVYPREPRAIVRGLAGYPRARGGDDLAGAPLGHRELRLRDIQPPDIVIDVEALVETAATVEREGADERAGREPRVFGNLGERARIVRHAIPAVVAHAVLERVATRQDAGM